MFVRKYHSSDVFQPNTFPEYTYVKRTINGRETYEDRLKKALRTKGVLTLITGASKSGKTVLCHSVISSSDIIEISGAHIQTNQDFWNQIAEKLKIPIETEKTSQDADEFNISGEIGGKGKVPFLDLNAKGTMGSKETQSSSIREKQQRSSNEIINFLIVNKIVLVVDDFHYIPESIQGYIARILKSEMFYGLNAVIVSLPHRADDAIRLNPDLTGRVRYINIEPWTSDELREIPKVGFELLSVTVDHKLLDLLVKESNTSPQLMQQNSLNLAFIANIDEDSEISLINQRDKVEESFVETTIDLNYETVINKIVTGPPQGKDKRNLYLLNDGSMVDIYSVILKTIQEDPPSIVLNIEDIQQRMKNVLDKSTNIPNPLTISNTLSQIQKILHASGAIFQIFDWREQQLHILDPFFLFYLRWSNKYNEK